MRDIRFPSNQKKRFLLRVSFLLFILCSCSLNLLPQTGKEKGLFPVYNFSPDTYNALAQNLSIAEDPRGILYFANNLGVLEYDGVTWELIRTFSPVKSVACDHHGRVYVGCDNEFGYLVPDSIGKLQFKTLKDFLPDESLDFGEIRHLFIQNERTIFQCNDFVFIWANNTIKVIEPENQIHESFLIDSILYADIQEVGLSYLDSDTFKLLPNGEDLKGKSVYGIVEIAPEKLIIAAQTSGLYLLEFTAADRSSSRIKKIATGVDDFLKYYSIFNLTKISDEKFSIGTWGGGAMIMDTLLNVLEIFNKSYGIQDDIVWDQFLDSHGNLWLGLSNGITRIEIGSPITTFGDTKGLTGDIQSITRFNDKIYVATTMGLFYLGSRPSDEEFQQLLTPEFKHLDNIQIECWDILTFKNQGEEILLVVTNNDVTEINRKNKNSVLLEEFAWYMIQSEVDPARVFIGLDYGLASLYRSGGRWENEGFVEGIDESIRHLSEDMDGNLWMGTEDQGVLKLEYLSDKNLHTENLKITRYDSIQGLPENQFRISQTGEITLVCTSEGIYRYVQDEDRFVPDSRFEDQFTDGSRWIHRVSEFKNNELWMVTISEEEQAQFEVGYFTPSNGDGYNWISKPFPKVSKGIIHAIYNGDNLITWLGGPEGLYRFDKNVEKDFESEFYTHIRNVSLSAGEMIFGGTFVDKMGYNVLVQKPDQMLVLPYERNSLIFNYAAQSGEDEEYTVYSYMLDGQDESWSPWTNQTFKEYTNLWEGVYHFKVRSKNIYDQQGIEAEYTFTILSPWYRTIPAYIAYALILAGVVYLIVRIYTRHLRAIIRERTAEIVEQKEEIEEKNREITDSIHYASRIQAAVLPPGDYINEILPARFILYLPRDIVSGDFYWITKSNGKIITVAADCTGHGVPGAFMSMLGVAFLNEIVSKQSQLRANDLLNELRGHVIKSLRQTGKEGESKDGMDIALCIIDFEKMQLEYAGANNPLFLVRDEKLEVFKPDKMPIGIHERANQPFKMHQKILKKGDILYTFSDGFVDQFGGPKGKKYMITRFKELLLQIHQKDLEDQKEILMNTFIEWMGNAPQIDDVLVMGVRI